MAAQDYSAACALREEAAGVLLRDADAPEAIATPAIGFRAAVLLFLCLLVLQSPLRGQTPIVRQLAPGVFYYWGDEVQQKSANCVWVIFKDYVVAVDANYPWGAQEILAEIRKTTSKPIRFVLNTHYHDDHSMGNSVFVDAGATIVSSVDTARELRAHGTSAWERGRGPGGHSLQPFRPEYPSLLFDEKMIFDDGEHRVEFIKLGQAHTLGDSVAYLPKEKIVATGDLFVTDNPWGNNVADPNADYDKWLKVLDKLSSWDVNIVVPGHGEIGNTESVKLQRAFLADMLQQVRAGIRAGRTADQLVKEVDLKKYKTYGSNTVSIARSVRAMYRKLAGAGAQ